MIVRMVGMTSLIRLTKGFEAIVDDEDFERFNRFSWHAVFSPSGWYARRAVRTKKLSATYFLHREILAPSSELVVDHINRNTLDNRRENLRAVSPSLNRMNSVKASTKAGFKGAHWDRTRGMWRADLALGGERHKGPRRGTEEEAARDYDDLVRRLVGENGRYNFPREGERSALA